MSKNDIDGQGHDLFDFSWRHDGVFLSEIVIMWVQQRVLCMMLCFNAIRMGWDDGLLWWLGVVRCCPQSTDYGTIYYGEKNDRVVHHTIP